MSKTYHVYIIECCDGSYYAGSTSELEQRINEHVHGLDEGAYTYPLRPVKFLWSQSFTDPDDMVEAERKLKGWTRVKKEALMRGDFHLLPGLSKKKRKKP